ncbi:MAG: hypothetical protein ACN6PQ_02340 [Stenotrophomonas indicatrix]|uniref:hypothetical protein n=1 Tax=Stenotrophomonas indicatrix TaxID=2045451 RepID=UPI003D0BB00D
MSWWKGVSTCPELGIDGCVVWWDGWAVVVAVVAVFATIFLGVATLWLGRQANRLGDQANELSQTAFNSQREADKARKGAETDLRNREKAVALAYCNVELKELQLRTMVIYAFMGPSGDFCEDAFVRSTSTRELLSNNAKNLKTDRLQSLLGRLHALPEEEGVDLARLLGICASVQDQLAVAAKPRLEPANEVALQRLRETHSRQRASLKRANEIAKKYSDMATKAIGEHASWS